MAKHRGVKTTIEIPENLLKAAKQKALDDDTKLRNVIITALEKLLGVKAETPEFKDGRRKTQKETKHARQR